MLSLIVCSINPDYINSLKSSVAATIGIEYEWLIWDNRTDNLGICEVYNKLAASARYPNLCFLHEDLEFKTPDWGKTIIQYFEKEGYSLVGIAGSNYKSQLFSGWYSGGGGGAKDYSNILHLNGREEFLLKIPADWNEAVSPVVTIDGVLMCCPKKTWQEHRFNENEIKGFHFYDLDYSLRVNRMGKVGVTSRIDIVHKTVGGDFGDKWIEQAFHFHQYAANMLPAYIGSVDPPKADLFVAKYWLDWLKNYRISFQNRKKWVFAQGLQKDRRLWYAILKFFLYRPMGLKSIHRIIKNKRIHKA
jgi:GT2 family glycosyltransferase